MLMAAQKPYTAGDDHHRSAEGDVMSVAQQNLESRRGLTELERPDAAAGKALAASVVGYAMDGFDFLILAFMLTAIRTDLGLSPAVGGSLATWTLVGAVAGGILFGVLSDYYGRVRVLTWTILIFAVFTGLCALAQGYWDLVAYRAIAGLGLGGEFGIGMALVAEAWPARLRARMLLRGHRLAGRRPAGGFRHRMAAAAYRLARHVPRRPFPRRDRIPGPLVRGRAAHLRRARHPHRASAQAAGQGRRHHENQPRHADPLLGAEFRLLRPDDLAAELSREPVRLQPAAIAAVDHRDGDRDGGRHFRVRLFRRPGGPAPGAVHLPGGRGRDGVRVLAAHRPDRAARRRRRHGRVRQRHARRLRRAALRALPDPGARHRRERAVQPRPRGRRLRAAGGRRAGRELLVPGGDRPAREHLRHRHHRHRAADPRAQRRAARVARASLPSADSVGPRPITRETPSNDRGDGKAASTIR